MAKFYHSQSPTSIYIPNPTWANHQQIFANVGLPVSIYKYYLPATKGLDFDGFLAALKDAPNGSVILLHACAHNPTGVDPDFDQWKALAAVIAERRHIPFFDCAYQGFASGDLDKDAQAIRYFVSLGLELVVAQSYAKNFGLYGQRTGCFHYVAPAGSDSALTARVASQLTLLQRSEISNPPAYGAKIVARVLNDPTLFSQWQQDLITMSSRIMQMRQALRAELERLGTPGTWSHVTDQIGMFSFTGLTPEQVDLLREKWHVYLTRNGRASVAGLNSGNVEYVGRAINDVVCGRG